MFLVSNRFLFKKDIPQNIIDKYSPISNNLVGINEYLEEFGIKKLFFKKFS